MFSEGVDVETKKYEWPERRPVSFLDGCDRGQHTQGPFLSLPICHRTLGKAVT